MHTEEWTESNSKTVWGTGGDLRGVSGTCCESQKFNIIRRSFLLAEYIYVDTHQRRGNIFCPASVEHLPARVIPGLLFYVLMLMGSAYQVCFAVALAQVQPTVRFWLYILCTNLRFTAGCKQGFGIMS